MKVSTAWLTEAEKSRIADEAMELLAGVGMRFAGSAILPELAARGAAVDDATGVARLPRELVEWALAQCPRQVLFAGATPDDDVLLDEGEPFHFAPSGCVAKTLDFRTGVRRASTLLDLRECTGLMDELPQLDIMWTQVSATDVPARAARARRVLHAAHRDAQARHLRRLPGRGRPSAASARRSPATSSASASGRGSRPW